MSIPLVINGATFEYPVDFDEEWGIEATGWAQAVTNGMLQRAGGNFPLLADVNFGTSFGLIAKYLTSESLHPATVGTIRLASADPGVAFRNALNTGNLILTTDATDNLTYSSGLKLGSALLLQNQSSVNFEDFGSVHTIAMSAPAVATNYNFMLPPNAGSAGQVLRTDGSGTTTWVNAAGGGTVNSGVAGHLSYYATTGTAISDAVSATILGTYNFTGSTIGITNVASQLFLSNSNGNGYLIAAGTPAVVSRTLSIPDPGADANFVLSEGGATINGTKTFTSIQLGGSQDANSHKIINLANGTTTTDAAAFGQITAANAGALPLTGGTMSGPIAMGSNKITGLANGTAPADAATFGQIPTVHAPTVQRFLSGSGTYTAPVSPAPLYIKITVIGAGGGGSGSGSSGGGNGGTGGTTSFGNASAAGGAGGTYSSSSSAANSGGAGGSPTVGAGITTIISQTGGAGSVAAASGSLQWAFGGQGGSSFYGGAGGSTENTAGAAGNANSGGGGSGGGSSGTSFYGGVGGGAGAYIQGFISPPTGGFSYSVGSGGSAGSAGANGFAGGTGGSGMVVVEEYYQ